MGWVKYSEPHSCEKPNTAPLGKMLKPGMVWECDRCGKGWRFKSWYDQRGESGTYWEPVSKEIVEQARLEQALQDQFNARHAGR